jgi:hypothetical protein
VNTDLPVITGVTTLNDKFQIIGKGCIQNGVIPMKLIAGAPQNLGGLVIGNYLLTPGQNLNSNQCQLASFVLEGDFSDLEGQEIHLMNGEYPVENTGYFYFPYRSEPVITENCTNILNKLKSSSDSSNVVIKKCKIDLDPSDVVNNKIIIRGSGVELDCHGARLNKQILVESPNWLNERTGIRQWQAIKNITLKNCNSSSQIRITGLGQNGEAEHVVASSHRLGHTQRAQFNAPRKVTIDNFLFDGEGIKLYISPGPHQVTLKNSRVAGRAQSVAIYMDTESGYNVIKNNRITTETYNDEEICFLGICTDDPTKNPRELVAVDGSAHNKIIGNYFASLNNGGIYLYRNCGENGGVRHQTPSFNHIVNNTFYYNKHDGSKGAIHLSNRNGNKGYCHLDDGYPFGSSISNRDMAEGNVIAQNQFYKFSTYFIIKNDSEFPNYILDNNDDYLTSHVSRKSGCIQDNQFYEDGEEILVEGESYLCKDGLIQ